MTDDPREILVIDTYTSQAKGSIEIIIEKVPLSGKHTYWGYLARVKELTNLCRFQIMVSRRIYPNENTADVLVKLICLDRLRQRLEEEEVVWPQDVCWPPEGWFMA
jgi:hypothetical protein